MSQEEVKKGDKFVKTKAQELCKKYVQITGKAVGCMNKADIKLALEQRIRTSTISNIVINAEYHAALVEFNDEHERDCLLNMETILDEGRILSIQCPTISGWPTLMENMKRHNVFFYGISEDMDRGKLTRLAKCNQMCCNSNQPRVCDVQLGRWKGMAVALIIYHHAEVANTVLQNHTPTPNNNGHQFVYQGKPVFTIYSQHVRDLQHGCEEIEKDQDIQPGDPGPESENPPNDPPGPYQNQQIVPDNPPYRPGDTPTVQPNNSSGPNLDDQQVVQDDQLNDPWANDLSKQQVALNYQPPWRRWIPDNPPIHGPNNPLDLRLKNLEGYKLPHSSHGATAGPIVSSPGTPLEQTAPLTIANKPEGSETTRLKQGDPVGGIAEDYPEAAAFNNPGDDSPVDVEILVTTTCTTLLTTSDIMDASGNRMTKPMMTLTQSCTKRTSVLRKSPDSPSRSKRDRENTDGPTAADTDWRSRAHRADDNSQPNRSGYRRSGSPSGRSGRHEGHDLRDGPDGDDAGPDDVGLRERRVIDGHQPQNDTDDDDLQEGNEIQGSHDDRHNSPLPGRPIQEQGEENTIPASVLDIGNNLNRFID